MILLDHFVFVDILLRAPAPLRRRMLRAHGRALRARTRPPAPTRSSATQGRDPWPGAARFWATVGAKLQERRKAAPI